MFRRKPEVQPQFLVFGLGNPGPRFAHTRHNAGWWVLDELARRAGRTRAAIRHRSQVEYCSLSGVDAALIKPTTFMNLSGESVGAWLRELPQARWCVVCDDISMAVGKARYRRQGSAGGHNGLKSIIAALGRDEFERIKLGVGAPEPMVDAAEHVLDQPPHSELELLQAEVRRSADALMLLAAGAPEPALLLALAGSAAQGGRKQDKAEPLSADGTGDPAGQPPRPGL
jgi:peptidyl-tRNA hydrolase, PTH1 family